MQPRPLSQATDLSTPVSLPALAMSCSADGVSVALVRADPGPRRSIESWREPAAVAKSDSLLAMIDGLLRANGLTPAQLAQLFVDTGPGPFTALRVACSVAQGIGLATGAPVREVWATRALALQAAAGREAGSYSVLVALDARMGEVYAATVDVSVDGLGEPTYIEESRPCVVVPPDQVWEAAGPGSASGGVSQLIAAGNAFVAVPALMPMLEDAAAKAGWGLQVSSAALTLDASSVLRVGLWQCDANESIEGTPVPRYVRNKVALDVDEQAAARARSGRTEIG